MTEKGRKFLADILAAIDLIEIFIEDTPNFNSYIKDLKTQSAVERQLVIVGEALNKLKQSDPDVLIHKDHHIIGFRNRLVHGYDSIDNTIVWVIIKRHLPELKTEIKIVSNHLSEE